ncbi:hypothetical protein Q8A73_001185 [Channa argus]|nr:hypothetical protein Q8A73_001185 [Channa argus]
MKRCQRDGLTKEGQGHGSFHAGRLCLGDLYNEKNGTLRTQSRPQRAAPQNEDFTALGRIRTLPRFHGWFSLLLIQQLFEPPVPATEAVAQPCRLNSLAEPACLAALRSAAACVSGIVLEGRVQKQQGAEDKQAIRDSLNTATVASTVEGCEDPRSNQAINPPCTSWSRHLSAARRTTPRHRLSATSHI